MTITKHLSLLCFLCMPMLSGAQLKVADIFSDNMVLQREQPITLWGKASPGKKVEVEFAGKKIRTIASADSTWKVSFPKQKASANPQSIIIKSDKESFQLKNILVGDIWICSGQSNMEWEMQKEAHFRAEIANTLQPLIRFLNPPPAGRYVYGVSFNDSINSRLNEKDFYFWNGWKTCDSNTVKDMSAVAYYFAKEIVNDQNIPIGLVNLSIGGAPIETFISREALENSKEFSIKVRGNWLENTSLPEWIRIRGKQNVGNHTPTDNMGPHHGYKPGFAFDAGIKPLLNFPVKGILWYQGESNSLEAARVQEYKDLQKLLIEDYRNKWKQPQLPFYWVQLSSIDTTHYQSQFWPQFRDEQRRLLTMINYGGMAVSSDIGFKNDVHPTNKKDIGKRLARWALYKTYNKEIIPSGPLPLQAKYSNGKVIITFKYAKGLRTSDGRELRGFSLDGINETAARIQHNKVLIQTSSKPTEVYYGWKPYSDANLENEEGLPASSFKIATK